MQRSLRAWVVTAMGSLLVCALLAPALAGAPVSAQGSDEGAAGFAVTTQEFEADRVDFEITVYENGSATWLFRYRKGLDSEEEARNFEAYATEFNENETDLYRTFRDGARRLTSNGSETTGREMTAANIQREARTQGLNDNLGIVEMSFRWDGFARVDGDSVVMGDVFEGGLYIGPDQRLIVRHGPTLAFGDVLPEDGEFGQRTAAESETVTWVGETSFNPNRPRVEFVDAGSSPTTSTAAEGETGWMLPVGVLLVVLILGLGAAFAYRTDTFDAIGSDARSDSNLDDNGAGATTPGGDVDTGGETAAGGAVGVPEEELISDDERVVNLLEENGGRMKQVNIVDETGWSKSKVSMLLSDMEDEGTISKLRVGRENIVSLAGHEPDAAGSPFDDEE